MQVQIELSALAVGKSHLKVLVRLVSPELTCTHICISWTIYVYISMWSQRQVTKLCNSGKTFSIFQMAMCKAAAAAAAWERKRWKAMDNTKFAIQLYVRSLNRDPPTSLPSILYFLHLLRLHIKLASKLAVCQPQTVNLESNLISARCQGSTARNNNDDDDE